LPISYRRNNAAADGDANGDAGAAGGWQTASMLVMLLPLSLLLGEIFDAVTILAAAEKSR